MPLLEFDSLHGDTISGITFLKALPLAGGIHESAAFNGMNVYPNPASGNVNISLPKTVSTAFVVVYNVQGEQITSIAVNSGKAGAVDLSAQPSGVYYLKVRSAEGIATREIVISK